MIDKENTIKKSKKKMEARYGISIVNIVKPSDDMEKYISILSREESLIYNRFTWSKEIDWHITLLRCHSLGNPIDMPNGYVEYLHKLFFSKTTVFTTNGYFKFGSGWRNSATFI